MQNRWAVMSVGGEWARDGVGKVLTFFSEENARAHCALLNEESAEAGWTTEEFTVDDALEEATRSPFAVEGGL
jgi:hypothetical protein